MRVRNFLLILAALTLAHGSKIPSSKNGLHADLMDFEALISLDSLQSLLLVHSNNNDVKNVTNYLSSEDAIDAKKAVLRIPEMRSFMSWIQDNYDNYTSEHNIKAPTQPPKVPAGVAPTTSHLVSAGAHKAPAGVHKVPAGAHKTPPHKTPAVSHNSATVTHNAAVAQNVSSAAKKTPGKVNKAKSSPKKKTTASKIPKKKIAKKISSRIASNGYNAYMEDMIDAVPMNEVKQLIRKKLEQDGAFAQFYKKMYEIEKPFKNLIQLPEVATFVHNLKELGVDPVKPWDFFKDFFDWK